MDLEPVRRDFADFRVRFSPSSTENITANGIAWDGYYIPSHRLGTLTGSGRRALLAEGPSIPVAIPVTPHISHIR